MFMQPSQLVSHHSATGGKELRTKRPFKIWDSWRNVRKGLVVSNFEELIVRGKEKLGVPQNENVSLVLESDGTQVEDGDYFKTLGNNTILLLLRHGERWCPTGVDIIRAAISAIPKIVCETIHALELHDETPSWKIMDNKGRVTVVLHWDQRSSSSSQVQQQQSKSGQDAQTSKYSPTKKADLSGAQRPSLVIQTSLDKLGYDGKGAHLPGEIASTRYTSPRITVINHDDMQQPAHSHAMPSRLVKQGTNSFDSTTIHIHTPECSNHIHQPVARNGSPVNGADGDGTKRPGLSKGHVRFRDTADEESSSRLAGASFHLHHHHHNHHQEHDSSESETENTIMEDEIVTSEKFLLLIDQLTVDQKHHLSIKDIGIILERLSSKILDVERLDRESESEECYNWTIKAIIRGDVLRELGVIYNGNYYAISEHPGYKEESEENNEDNEEEEEDRL
ncbi:Cell death activator CIDE-B [Harpegnathos saltator]|uniref:Cell death activator CIDE-B n=1 Tax=Harpegnathos saltator TaxID=610380 RepID=E2BF64_HARSA|nr:Cell death activator CIDE-B [Harpegnathos saltator]